MKEFNLEELNQYKGQDGNPIYIAYKGRVIDVSESKLWKGGLHMRRHHSGNDLTNDIQAAPHGLDVLDRYPQVGVLKEQAQVVEEELPQVPLVGLISRFPRLKRHPHPMTVHFPIVFMFAATFFYIAYAVTGHKPFETTAVYSLGAGILFTPVAMITGFYTWWLNYDARPIRPVKIKQRTSFILLAVAVTVFAWRVWDPGVLDQWTVAGGVFFFLVLSLFPLVSVVGWFGAHLTFPMGKK